MKKTLLATLLLAAIQPVFAQDGKPVAVVNGRAIPAIYGELAKQVLLNQGAPNDATLEARAREVLVNQELLSRAAIEKGLEKNPRLAAVLDMQRQEQLTKAYVEDYIKTHPVTDAEIQTEYDRATANVSGNEYKARHILVKGEAEAKAIIAQLNKKVAFDKLAREKSKDPGSAKEGGDLGWAMPANFVPEFAKALAALKKGETTKEPVKTQFGYHIIRVEEVRPVKIPPLAEVKGDILRQIQQKRVREAVAGLRASAKIE